MFNHYFSNYFYLISLLFGIVSSQDCYVPGICVNSEFLGAVVAREINNCMGYCERKAGCRYRSVLQNLIETSYRQLYLLLSVRQIQILKHVSFSEIAIATMSRLVPIASPMRLSVIIIGALGLLVFVRYASVIHCASLQFVSNVCILFLTTRQGNLIQVFENAYQNRNYCWVICKNTEGCQWASYDIPGGYCFLFDTCSTIQEDLRFTSGPNKCNEK